MVYLYYDLPVNSLRLLSFPSPRRRSNLRVSRSEDPSEEFSILRHYFEHCWSDRQFLNLLEEEVDDANHFPSVGSSLLCWLWVTSFSQNNLLSAWVWNKLELPYLRQMSPVPCHARRWLHGLLLQHHKLLLDCLKLNGIRHSTEHKMLELEITCLSVNLMHLGSSRWLSEVTSTMPEEVIAFEVYSPVNWISVGDDTWSSVFPTIHWSRIHPLSFLLLCMSSLLMSSRST